MRAKGGPNASRGSNDPFNLCRSNPCADKRGTPCSERNTNRENKMGGCEFSTKGKGKTARAAFDAAVNQAQYDHGHSGYSGTIAEKHEFTMITPPFDRASCASDGEFEKRVNQYADEMICEGDPRIDDKWGPAGCIQLSADTFLFFGWASS